MKQKKIYWHKSLLLGILFWAALAVASFIGLRDYGGVFTDGLGFIISSIFLIVSIYGQWKYRYKKEPRAKRAWEYPSKLEHNSIIFPEGYPFKVSSIYKSKKIAAHQINAVNLKTYPKSVVINDNEVIFLNQVEEAELIEFAERNELPIEERFDIWGTINEVYLDTEFTAEEKAMHFSDLAENGISKAEAQQIRKKIKWTMFTNYFAWEWIYLGQFDYLAWGGAFLKRSNYWWSMEIALRNYETSPAISS